MCNVSETPRGHRLITHNSKGLDRILLIHITRRSSFKRIKIAKSSLLLDQPPTCLSNLGCCLAAWLLGSWHRQGSRACQHPILSRRHRIHVCALHCNVTLSSHNDCASPFVTANPSKVFYSYIFTSTPPCARAVAPYDITSLSFVSIHCCHPKHSLKSYT